MTLKQKFFQLPEKYNIQAAEATTLWKEIEESYSAEGRHYHTLSHLENMFTQLEEVKEKLSDAESVAWAVFYHDLVYNVQRGDNEERSAESAVAVMKSLNVPEEKCAAAQQLILATKSHSSEADMDTHYFLDADLSVLGADAAAYDKYAVNIRKEYAVYPDEVYRAGRKKVLKHFIDMERIFKTDHFYRKFEERAKENLRRELHSL